MRDTGDMSTPQQILERARAAVARGADPDWAALERELRGSGDALRALDRLRAVHRARTMLAPPAPAPAPAPRRRAAFRARPTVSGNMELRRDPAAAAPTLRWPPAPGVAAWEIRISGRADARSDYEVIETRELPPAQTTLEVELAATPVRVHVLGRSAGGRLVRHAIASGLTEENFSERWQRRATAS